VLATTRDLNTLRNDVQNMRAKMRNHLDKSSPEKVDIKQGRGGLVDIEFFVQYLVLASSAKHPELSAHSDNISLLENLAKLNLITQQEQQLLINNYCKLRDFGHHATLKNNEQMLLTNIFQRDFHNILPILNKVLS